MAGRPFTGSSRTNADGSVTVRIPATPGSTEKITARFPNEQLRDRWLAAVAAARQYGQPTPNAALYQRIRESAEVEVTSESFSEIAWKWHHKFYEARMSTEPSRAESVASVIRLHLIPFFDPLVDSIRDITYAHCDAWLEHLAGIRRASEKSNSAVVVAEHRLLTISEAAEWSGKSRSTIMKAWLAKKFPHAYNDAEAGKKGIVRIPIGDLIAVGYIPQAQTTEVPFGYAVTVANGHLNILHRIFTYAVSLGIIDRDPTAGLKAISPVSGTRSLATPKDDGLKWLNLVASKEIAERLHIHHRLAFWIMRLTGQRIGETYGIDLASIHREGEHMALMIEFQGGKNQKVRNAQGRVVTVTRKKRTKTRAGTRYIPIPTALADLIDVYVTAFHEPDADPETPLIRSPRGLGRSGFVDALRVAVADAGFGMDIYGFKVIPKFLRVCLVSDLTPVDERLRSIYVGHKVKNHKGGAAVTEDRYTRRRAGIEHLLPVTDFLNNLIEEEIGILIDPTPLDRLLPGNKKMDPPELTKIVDAFDEAGLLGDEIVDDEQVISMNEAAQILALTERQVRELALDGHLERRSVRGAGKTSGYGVTASSVQHRLEIDQELWTRQRICDELGLTYVELRRLLRRLDIKPINNSATLGERYRDEEVDLLRNHLDMLRQQRDRSVTVQQVADELGCTRRTIGRFITMGKLQVDHDATENLMMTMVTRASVDTVIGHRQNRASLPVVCPPGSIPIAEAQARTGLTRVQVLELKKSGVIIHRTPDYQFHVDETSFLKAVSEQD